MTTVRLYSDPGPTNFVADIEVEGNPPYVEYQGKGYVCIVPGVYQIPSGMITPMRGTNFGPQPAPFMPPSGDQTA
jgi:hypothetical protein